MVTASADLRRRRTLDSRLLLIAHIQSSFVSSKGRDGSIMVNAQRILVSHDLSSNLSRSIKYSTVLVFFFGDFGIGKATVVCEEKPSIYVSSVGEQEIRFLLMRLKVLHCQRAWTSSGNGFLRYRGLGGLGSLSGG